jgi:hypothetical protein
MAQPQQPYPPRTYSPLQSASLPSNTSFLAPSKRQRLSPHTQSPYNSPSIPNIALPNQLYSSPRYGGQPSDLMSYDSRNPSNHRPPNGAMGPPSRPSDKPTDMNELSDVLVASGIDVKEEEAALNPPNLSNQRQTASSSSNFANTFHSFGPNSSGTTTGYNGYNVLAQNAAGDRSSPYSAVTFNQPGIHPQPAEDLAEAEQRRSIDARAEKLQYHPNDPFLLTGWVQQRLWQVVKREGITRILPSNNTVNDVPPRSTDQTGLLSTTRGQDTLSHDAPLMDFFTLISLATKDRLRALVEEAAALAKGRRVGSHGIVPSELADLAAGSGEFGSGTALPTPGNSAVSPKSNPLKRMSTLCCLGSFLYSSYNRLL